MFVSESIGLRFFITDCMVAERLGTGGAGEGRYMCHQGEFNDVLTVSISSRCLLSL